MEGSKKQNFIKINCETLADLYTHPRGNLEEEKYI